MKHAATPAPDDLTARRLELVEQQLADLSRRYVQLGAEHRAQAAIIRRRNVQVWLLAETLRRLLLSYCALGRIRPAYEPWRRVLDTGTPGVEVSGR